MLAACLTQGRFPADFPPKYPRLSGTPSGSRLETILRALDGLSESIRGAEIDETGIISPDLFAALFDLGLFSLMVPLEYKGEGLSLEEYAQVVQALTILSTGLAVTVVPHSGMGMKAVLRFGTPQQKASILPAIRADRRLLAFCLTESEAGSDVTRIQSSVRRVDGEQFSLNGSKAWITNAVANSCLVVLAKSPELSPNPEAITFFLTSGNQPGIEIRQPYPKMALEASQTSELFFHDVSVAAGDILGAPGKGVSQFNELVGPGRIGVASGSLGLLKKAFLLWESQSEIRASALREDAELLIFQMESLLTFCCSIIDLDDEDKGVFSALAKIFCTEAALKMILRLYGDLPAEKQLRLNGLSRVICEAPVMRVTEGPNEVVNYRCGLELVFAASAKIGEAGSFVQTLRPELREWAEIGQDLLRSYSGFLASSIARNRPLTEKQNLLNRFVELSIELIRFLSVLWKIDSFVSLDASSFEKIRQTADFVRRRFACLCLDQNEDEWADEMFSLTQSHHAMRERHVR